MINVHLPSSIFYVNRTETVSCSVSTLFFAFGGIIKAYDEDEDASFLTMTSHALDYPTGFLH
jgi:hypothetical protein